MLSCTSLAALRLTHRKLCCISLILQESKLLEYVIEHATKGDVTSVINTIDQWCYAGNWMMNG